MKKTCKIIVLYAALISFVNCDKVDAADLIYGKLDSSDVSQYIVNFDNDTQGGVVKSIIGGLAVKPGGWDFDYTAGLVANGNKVIVNGGKVEGGTVQISIIGGGTISFEGVIAGGYSNYTSGNEVEINGGNIETDIYGSYNIVYNNKSIEHPDIYNNKVYIYAGKIDGSIYGTYVDADVSRLEKDNNNNKVINNKIYVGKEDGTSVVSINGNIYGAYAHDQYAVLQKNKVIINDGDSISITSSSSTGDGVYGAYTDKKYCSTIENSVVINGGTIKANIAGAYNNQVYRGVTRDNCVEINGGEIEGKVYGAYTQSGMDDCVNNKVIITGEKANLEKADLFGCNVNNFLYEDSGNDLIVDGWHGKINSANNFNNIKFQNLKWQNKGTVLEIGSTAYSNLADTNINLISIAGGQEINIGDYMYIIKGNGDLNINEALVDKNFSEGVITAGVATEINGEAFVDNDGNVQYKVTGTSVNDQINLVAENRAVAAAFVNQGTDLINDSLDVLSRDGKYGIKTFAAVHGNRSKYDVNSDLKINGWSGIVGVGNEKNIGNGDFSWGVFYENGSGNYRTYNEFNNEFFRGDGSLVYNGGGIAARFEQDNGVYTEGSLRAGMLKSEMTNALKDGAGNSYGYKSESTYYGAHLGVGKIISLNEATDLDVYGKFFHTYTDGDSFTVANDKFEFDSITSDRLRIGARLTTNKENKFSTYYGLAYEYEFNGDADMRAQNMSAPEQSLKGSSCMAEIGMNYKPSSESPWSFDLSMRGYVGQRDGFSGNVQATYTF